MILSNLCLCYWAVFVLNVAIDGTSYLVVGAIIHAILCVPLIRQRMPIKFTEEMDWVYNEYFEPYLTRFEFRKVLQLTQLRIKRRVIAGTKIIVEKNPFEAIFLITKLPKTSEMAITMQGTKV